MVYICEKCGVMIFMYVTGKHILLFVTILSLIAYAGLLVWKFIFDGNIPGNSLLVLGFLEIALVVVNTIRKEGNK